MITMPAITIPAAAPPLILPFFSAPGVELAAAALATAASYTVVAASTAFVSGRHSSEPTATEAAVHFAKAVVAAVSANWASATPFGTTAAAAAAAAASCARRAAASTLREGDGEGVEGKRVGFHSLGPIISTLR